MSTNSAPPPLGLTIALCQQALTRRLHEVLAEHDTPPGEFYARQVLANRGPMTRAALTDLLAQSPSSPAAPDAVDRLIAAGEVVVEGPQLALSDAGRERHVDLSRWVGALTRSVLKPIDADDLATTIRTLQAVTERADALAPVS